MAVFILSTDGRGEDVLDAFKSYESYLRSRQANFPSSAYALATSDWYFGNSDHRAPHDAWLETVEFKELSSGQRHEQRQLSLTIRLLGAYHDGFIELHYPQVFAYTRSLGDASLLVLANLSGEEAVFDPAELPGWAEAELVLANLGETRARSGVLRPWEAVVLGRG